MRTFGRFRDWTYGTSRDAGWHGLAQWARTPSRNVGDELRRQRCARRRARPSGETCVEIRHAAGAPNVLLACACTSNPGCGEEEISVTTPPADLVGHPVAVDLRE